MARTGKTRAQWLAEEIARAVGAGKTACVETVDFSDYGGGRGSTVPGPPVNLIIGTCTPGYHAVEVKSGMTVRPAMLTSLRNTMALWENDDIRGWVVYGGNRREELHGNTVLPWNELGSLPL